MVKTNRAVVNEQWVVHTSCASRNATQRDARTRRSAARNSHGLRSTRRSIISLHVGIKLHNPTLLLILLQFLVPVSTWIATQCTLRSRYLSIIYSCNSTITCTTHHNHNYKLHTATTLITYVYLSIIYLICYPYDNIHNINILIHIHLYQYLIHSY